MLKIISDYILYKKIQKFNKNEFNQENDNNTRGILLLEFNSFHILHIIFSYLSNYFVKKNNLKIVAYYSHVLLSYKLERTVIQKIKSFIADKFCIGFFDKSKTKTGKKTVRTMQSKKTRKNRSQENPKNAFRKKPKKNRKKHFFFT